MSDLSVKSGIIAADEGWVTVPREPPIELLVSMAVRDDHGLGVPGYYDQPFMHQINNGVKHARRMESAISTMRKLYEEVVGDGFYAPERAERYRELLPPPPVEGGGMKESEVMLRAKQPSGLDEGTQQPSPSWSPTSEVKWSVGLDGPYTMRLRFFSWSDLDGLCALLAKLKRDEAGRP